MNKKKSHKAREIRQTTWPSHLRAATKNTVYFILQFCISHINIATDLFVRQALAQVHMTSRVSHTIRELSFLKRYVPTLLTEHHTTEVLQQKGFNSSFPIILIVIAPPKLHRGPYVKEPIHP